MMPFLLRIWRTLPLWVHFLAARLVRPRFRAAVAALIFNELGHVLLFKHTYRKFEWGIPAGGLEHHEQPIDAVKREFFEETGMQIEVLRLLIVTSAREDHHLGVVYLCKISDGQFKPSLEISEIQYFPVDALPSMMLTTEKELIHWAVKEI